MQSLLSLPSGGNYFDGYEVRQVTGNSLHITRRYVPPWAFVVAIIGCFFFLIGLLALLVRDTEVLTVTVYQQEDGSYLDCAGTAASSVTTLVNSAIDRLINGVAMAGGSSAFPAMPTPAFPTAPAASRATPPIPVQPAQPAAASANKICPECAETIRVAARSCRFCGYRFDPQPGGEQA